MEKNLYVFDSEAARELRLQLAQGLFEKGAVAENTGQCDLALDLYKQSVACNPGLGRAWVGVGYLELKNDNEKEAEACFDRALAATPRSPLALFTLGLCLDDRNLLHEAVVCYKQALALDHSYADAHFNLARIYDVGKEYRKAIRHYNLYVQYGYKEDEYPIFRLKAQSQIARLRQYEQLQLVPQPIASGE